MRMTAEERLELLSIEIDRLEDVISACSSLSETLNSVRVADVRTAAKELKRLMDTKCPVCKFIKKQGGHPSTPGMKCCSAWRRCRKYLYIQHYIENNVSTTLGILSYRRRMPAYFDEYYSVRRYKTHVAELNTLLNRIKNLEKKNARKANDLSTSLKSKNDDSKNGADND